MLIDNRRYSKRALAVFFLAAGIWGCNLATNLAELKRDPNQLYVKVTTEPEHCKIVLRSMNTSNISSYNSPVEINYLLRPFMASYIEVSQKGYKTKTVRLDPDKEKIHIKLDLLTQEEINRVKFYETSTMGPGSHGEIGGGMDLDENGIPDDDIGNEDMGMGGFSEFGM